MIDHAVSLQDLRQVIDDGEVLRRYPEDKPYESRLILRFVEGCPLHVVAADAGDRMVTYIITVYRPDPERWDKDFRRKR